MKLKLTALLLVFFATTLYAQEKKSFIKPPDSARPWIFWDWMDDLVSKKGITSDLEHFQKFGVRGTLIMLVGRETGSYPMWDKSNMPHPVVSQTPEFFDLWKFAAEESNRLGMVINTQLGPGWCHSGGPWVTPAQSVQHVAYTQTESIEGPGKNVNLVLSNTSVNKGNAYHSEITNKDTPKWVQIKLPKASNIDEVILHPFTNGEIVGFGFPLQFTIETANNADFSDAKIFYKTTADIAGPRASALVLKGNAIGQYVRVTSTKNYTVFREGETRYLLSLAEVEVRNNGNNMAVNADVTASSSIEKYDYTTAALTDNCNKIIYKTADNTFLLEHPGDQYFTADIAILAYPDKDVIKPGEVINLTSQFKNNHLAWTVPPGKWVVRRYAMRNALAYNRPAPIGGKGLECDKLDKDAVDAEFDGMVGRYIKNSPKLVGKTIKGFEADSWEVGNPEWTPTFKAEFIKRRGYDPTPWMITYKTTNVVGNKALTKRFLNDMYLTQTDMFADNFFTHLANKATSLGMDFMTEPYTGPFDPVRMGGRIQIPTGEFWASGHYMKSLRWVSSAAHTYGRQTVATEAFTGHPYDNNWKMDVYGLKRMGDLAFCNGTNKMILHGTALQPWGTDVKPGMPMFFWGTMFAPGQTWMDPARTWVDYIARCSYMLHQGINVADVVGVMPTLDWANSMPEGLHKQYNYDLMSEETLLKDMDWKNGYFILPSGAKYRVLFLPKTNGKLSAAIISKLISLVKKGGTVVCQDKPQTAPGLTNYPQCDVQVKQLANILWGKCDGKTIFNNTLGKGKFIWMDQVWNSTYDPEGDYFVKTRGDAWKTLGTTTTHWSPELTKLLNSFAKPDVEVLKAGGKAMAWGGFEATTTGNRVGENAIAWTHRKTLTKDIYFVSSQVATDNETELLFRVKNKIPELWNAEDGKMYRPEKWSKQGDRIKVSIRFMPMGSVFVVFKPAAEAGKNLPVYNAVQKVKTTIPLDEKWVVTFPAGYGAPAKAEMTAGDWTNNTNNGIKYFSGTATYNTTITVDKDQLKSNIILDLGLVRNLAEVYVNNIAAATLWKPPFKTDITALLKPGQNSIKVKITNTWWNRMVGDEQLPEDLKWGARIDSRNGYPLKEIPEWVWSGAQRPSKDRVTFTTWKFIEKNSPLEPAGLIGPVKLELAEK